MKKPLKFAIGLQVLIMLSVFIPPLITLQTGATVYLETERVDPRALFRGDYVILSYEIGSDIELDLAKEAYRKGSAIYVTVTADRPAQFVSASLHKPDLQANQNCLIARPLDSVEWISDEVRVPRIPGEDIGQPEFAQNFVQFPQISQYFVPEGTGKDIEQNLNDMVAELAVTKGCKAVVRGLELL